MGAGDPVCGNFARPWSFLGSLCEHMWAERARCLGMIWLYWPCGWSLGAGVQRNCPPPTLFSLPSKPPSLNTHSHCTHSQLPSRLILNHSIGFLWFPDYSINRSWTIEFMNLRWVSESIHGGQRGNRWLFLLLVKLLEWNNLFQAVHELIPDSHKSSQVQYNRAKSLIIPILLQDFLNEYNCSNNVANAPKTNSW